jgi:hypothetical protein
VRTSGRHHRRQTVVHGRGGRSANEADLGNALGVAGLVCCLVGHFTNEHVGIATFVVLALLAVAGLSAGLLPPRPK